MLINVSELVMTEEKTAETDCGCADTKEEKIVEADCGCADKKEEKIVENECCE